MFGDPNFEHVPASCVACKTPVPMRLSPSSFRLPFVPVLALLLMAGCETPIDVEIPLAEPMLVVEGRIETGAPPIVLLSRSQNYFDPVDATLSLIHI